MLLAAHDPPAGLPRMLTAAQQQLAERYVPLALAIAGRYPCGDLWRDDIKGAALHSLCNAARLYETSRAAAKGVPFPSYAWWAIRRDVRHEWLLLSRPKGYRPLGNARHCERGPTVVNHHFGHDERNPFESTLCYTPTHPA